MREKEIAEIEKVSEKLASDLSLLFEIKEDAERLGRIKITIADKSIAVEEFLKIVPWNIIEISLVFLNELTYQLYTRNYPEYLKTVLEEARVFIVGNLADLQKHPAVLKKIEEQQPGKEESKKIEPLNFNVIKNIYPMPFLFPKGKNKYIPLVRVGFMDYEKKLLLDTTLDWDDLLFLSSSLLGIFCNEIESHKSLAEQGGLILDNSLGEKLSSIQKSLDTLRNNIGAYNIVIGKEEAEAPKEGG